MKKRALKEWILDMIMQLILPFVKLYLYIRFDIKRTFTNFTVKENKRTPYILLCNHVLGIDALLVSLPLKRRLRFLTNTLAFFNKKAALGLKVSQMIEIKKGSNDLMAMRKILSSIKKGYSIGIAPEGSMSFYGDTGYIQPSIAKLIKKLNVDVITCKISGGYFASPRWAEKKRRRAYVELVYSKIYTSETIKNTSIDDIYQKLNSNLYNNEYEWQSQNEIEYKCRQKTVGIERIVYFCYKCNSIGTIYGIENKVVCTKCGVIAKIDKYEFLECSKFSDLIQWRSFQRNRLKDIDEIASNISVLVKIVDYEKRKTKKIGIYDFKFANKKMILVQNSKTIVFDVNKMTDLALSHSSLLVFDYEEISYQIKTNNVMLLWDLIMLNKAEDVLGKIENFF